MSTSDLKAYAPILDALVGAGCERSLPTNSLKLRFWCESDARGTHYIWIDPPWQFHGPSGLITASSDCPEAREDCEQWSALFDPLNQTVFNGYESLSDGTLILHFQSGFRVVVPLDETRRDEDTWYDHWYATATERAS